VVGVVESGLFIGWAGPVFAAGAAGVHRLAARVRIAAPRQSWSSWVCRVRARAPSRRSLPRALAGLRGG
jgi:hypothetical protein